MEPIVLMRFKALQVLVLSVIACFGLTSFGAEADDYLQIHEGREWTSDVTIRLPDGRIESGIGHSLVEGKVQHAGRTYHRVRISLEGGPLPFKIAKLVRKDAAGVYTIPEGDPEATEQMEVKLPLKVGATWQRPFGGVMLKESVVGMESVTIGDKIYKECYRVRSETPDGMYVENYWEAPGIGSVKSETVYSNGLRILWTLREFKPGKP